MRRALLLLLGLSLWMLDCACPPWCRADDSTPELPQKISPNDSKLRLTGRWELTPQVRCEWSGCGLEFSFAGKNAEVYLEGNGPQFQIVIDGQIMGVIKLTSETRRYVVAHDLDSTQSHKVELFKRTEPLFGAVTFLGVGIEAKDTLQPLPPRPERGIEFIGDSITCGYGNEAPDEKHHFEAATENNYLSYGALAARDLGAEYHCEAWTGAWMMNRGNVVVPKIFPLTLPDDPASLWDFTRWVPQVVVINLGTNDFSGELPKTEKWIKQYGDFVAKIRQVYPKTFIFLATGPMLDESKMKPMRENVRQVVQNQQAAGDVKIAALEFPPQEWSNGLGADYHPSLKTHRIMADFTVKAVKSSLGW